MRKSGYIICAFCVLFSCKKDDINLFDKSADERVAEAIAALKAELVRPEDGWKVQYRPESGSGSFFVLLKFDEDNNVTIKSDLSLEDGAYHEQTVSYRIDSSLGLELVFENYCFFSFLFEQDLLGGNNAPAAEYEFRYLSKNPNNTLSFESKTDLTNEKTILLLQEAAATDENLLGLELADKLTEMTEDFPDKISHALNVAHLNLVYENKDLILYITANNFKRTFTITAASRKSDINAVQTINFKTGFTIRQDSLIFETPFSDTYFGSSVSINSISFDDLTEGDVVFCTDPVPVHTFGGMTSADDDVTLKSSIIDGGASSFSEDNDYFSGFADGYIYHNGEYEDSVDIHIKGATHIQLYYGLEVDDESFNGIGFRIENENDSVTYALRGFTQTLENNRVIFTFDPGLTLLDAQLTDADTSQINLYLDYLTENDQTYVFKILENDGAALYEFYNPCTGWSFAFWGDSL